MDLSLPPVSADGAKYKPYPSSNHQVNTARYITSNDPRGYIPVYEYPLNGQWIMMDMDDGYILWTGIWKALGNSKADIVRMVESQPDLASRIRRVRGGYLKIQGTWLPHDVALQLSRRVAYPIRDELIPFFGPTFPSTCLSPEQPGYGRLVPRTAGRAARLRRSNSGGTSTSVWLATEPPAPSHSSRRLSDPLRHVPGALKIPEQTQTQTQQDTQRYSPYPSASSSSSESPRWSDRHHSPPSAYRTPPSAYHPPPQSYEYRAHNNGAGPLQTYSAALPQGPITLPPLQPRAQRSLSVTLPPISALGSGGGGDSGAVLRRLKESDDYEWGRPGQNCQPHASHMNGYRPPAVPQHFQADHPRFRASSLSRPR